MKKIKNFTLHLLCNILPARKHLRGEQKRILIVSTTGLGDTLWGTPAIESLRRSFPQAHLAALTSPVGEEVLKTNPRLNALYVVKEPMIFSFFSLWRTLYKEMFCTVLIFHASQRLVFPLSVSLGATDIIGTKGINKGLDSLFTKTLKPHYEHEILRRLRIVQEVGGDVFSQTLSFFPKKKASPQENTIILHPGSKDGFKRWPLQNFITLGKELQKLGAKIVVTGTKEERELLENISSSVPGSTPFEIPSVDVFSNVLQSAKLLISNDTGSVHLASALKTPVIALYGPTDPVLCGPHIANNTKVLQVKPSCTPCIKRKCKEPFCLRQIGVNEVLREAQATLEPKCLSQVP